MALRLAAHLVKQRGVLRPDIEGSALPSTNGACCLVVFGGVFLFFRVREHRQKQMFAVFTIKEDILCFVHRTPVASFRALIMERAVSTETTGGSLKSSSAVHVDMLPPH